MSTSAAPTLQIPLCIPHFPGNERRYLLEALDSGFVSSVGPFVERFERAFAASVGSPHAIACASGTAAIHLALRALGVGPQDLVLCSDFTFIASANPVRYQGAELGFIDSERASWNLDPALLVQALDELEEEGRLPKAVIAVHVLGQPADLGPVAAACARHGVALIEDAAEALGGRYREDYPHPGCAGRQVGTIGRIGCFSFNGNKIMTTGGGGMLTTADAELAARLRHLSTQAKLPGIAFVHDQVGYNYRLTNLAAALGLGQLECLPQFLARKRAIAARYRRWCSERHQRWGTVYQPVLPGTEPSDWLCSFTAPERDRLIAGCTGAGIQVRPLWLPLSAQPCLPGFRRWSSAHVADQLAAEGISVPCSTSLADGDLERVLAALDQSLDQSLDTRARSGAAP
jgi:dTDP-4-amino-4,6-dideoxygalactose transaminase